jgi:hypothetical protein
LYEDKKEISEEVVIRRDTQQQCTRSGVESFYEECKRHCDLTEAIGRTKHQEEGNTVSVGNVDAKFLHQSCRKKFIAYEKEKVGVG